MGANHTRPQYARKVAIFGLFWHFWAFDPTSQVFFTPVDGLYDWILSFSIQYVCKDDVGTSFLKINFFPYSPPNGPLWLSPSLFLFIPNFGHIEEKEGSKYSRPKIGSGSFSVISSLIFEVSGTKVIYLLLLQTEQSIIVICHKNFKTKKIL